jgi:hypothetical protein
LAAQRKKCPCTRSGHSVSDAASHLTLDHDAHHHFSLNLKYLTDSASQDSNDQGSNSGNSNENGSQEDCMEIGEEKVSESGDPQFRGQFWNQFDALFSNSKKIHVLTLAYA